jgi:predicted transglutaminase-like cysteine proteinase
MKIRLENDYDVLNAGDKIECIRKKNFVTVDTVTTIRELIKQSAILPQIRMTAENVLTGIQEKNWYKEIETIFEYVRANMRYTRDINDVEMIKTPLRHLTDIKERGITYGDCDDYVVLLGSLLVSAGYKIKLSVIQSLWNDTGGYNHIFLEVNIPFSERYIVLDASDKTKEMGFEPAYKLKRSFEV